MFPYFGGKHYMRGQIKLAMPRDYSGYGELFGGSGKVLFSVPQREIMLWNDLDKDVYDIFYCVKHQAREFLNALLSLEFSEENYNRLRNSEPKNQSENAVRSYVGFAQACDGRKWDTFRRILKRTRNGYDENQSRWYGNIKNILHYSRQLESVQMFNTTYRDSTFQQFDKPGMFWYFDPPYVNSTRISLGTYTHDFTDLDQVNFLTWVTELQGHVMISGYECELYRDLLPGWRVVELESFNRCTARRGRELAISTERLYLNY